jgi:hypothetical protein
MGGAKRRSTERVWERKRARFKIEPYSLVLFGNSFYSRQHSRQYERDEKGRFAKRAMEEGGSLPHEPAPAARQGEVLGEKKMARGACKEPDKAPS